MEEGTEARFPVILLSWLVILLRWVDYGMNYIRFFLFVTLYLINSANPLIV
jgi:hypothetical protein